MKWIIGILVVLMFAGCTGEKLAPGGTADIRFTFAENGKINGATVTTNRDSTIALLKFDISKGTFELRDYSGNGSSLGAIQAQASAAQAAAIAASTAKALDVVAAALPLLTKVPAVTPAPVMPPATPAKTTP